MKNQFAHALKAGKAHSKCRGLSIIDLEHNSGLYGMRIFDRTQLAPPCRGEEYLATCARPGLEDLATRRTRLALTFAKRTAFKSRHIDTFTRLENPRPPGPEARSGWSHCAGPGATRCQQSPTLPDF